MDDASRIADVEDVPTDGTLLVTLAEFDGPDIDDTGDEAAGDDVTPEATATGAPPEVEAILVRDGEDVTAWRNYCVHWTDVRLDRGSGAPVRDGELVCRKHGATFEKASGTCTFGPCEGGVLEGVDVAVADGAVYLADDDYAFRRVGPAEDGESGATSGDRSTSPGERLGF